MVVLGIATAAAGVQQMGVESRERERRQLQSRRRRRSLPSNRLKELEYHLEDLDNEDLDLD